MDNLHRRMTLLLPIWRDARRAGRVPPSVKRVVSKASILLRGPAVRIPVSLPGTLSLSAVNSEPAGEKARLSPGDIALGNAAKPELPADCVVPKVASPGEPKPADLAVHYGTGTTVID